MKWSKKNEIIISLIEEEKLSIATVLIHFYNEK
jgi:hypothetical protein